MISRNHSAVEGEYECVYARSFINVLEVRTTEKPAASWKGVPMPGETRPPFADCETDVRMLSRDDAVSEIERCLLGVPFGGLLEVLVSSAKAAAELLDWAAVAGYGAVGSIPGPECHKIYLTHPI